VKICADLHRPIWQCLKRISLQERVTNRLNRVKLELVGEISPDGIGMRRVVCRFADVVDRGPAGAGAGEDPAQSLCRDLNILTKVYRKLLVEAVDDKIKQLFLFYLVVCFGRLHILPKQTLPLTRCDRLTIASVTFRYGNLRHRSVIHTSPSGAQ
jgi:hypothetical protein